MSLGKGRGPPPRGAPQVILPFKRGPDTVKPGLGALPAPSSSAAPATTPKGAPSVPRPASVAGRVQSAQTLAPSTTYSSASKPQGGKISIAEACAAAARGDTSGDCVKDSDIKVVDSYDRPMRPEKFASFDQCTKFPRQVLAELKKAFPGPSQIQAYTWPLALQDKDIIGIAATGSGKTLAFLLPAFSEFVQTGMQPLRDGVGLLVMSPTRELAQQIEVEANRFGKCIGMWTVSMYGGAKKWDQLQKYKQGAHAIIACPGRLNDVLDAGQVKVDRVRKLVLDEADRMLDMGFEPQIRRILEHVPKQRHTMFFTATWPREVRQLANTVLRQPTKVMIGDREEAKANQDVIQECRVVEHHAKRTALMDLLSEAGLLQAGATGKALVFAGTKRMCEELSQELIRSRVSCAAIHGDKEQWDRDQALNGLKQGRLRVLVATDVAARGLDIKGVGLVVNYDPANNIEDYVHRIGRTGRAGAKGYAVTLLTRGDESKASGIVKVMQSVNQPIPPELQRFARGGGGSSWGGGSSRYGGGSGGGKGGSFSSFGKGGKGRAGDRSRSPRRDVAGGRGGPGEPSCRWCSLGECWTHKGSGKGGARR